MTHTAPQEITQAASAMLAPYHPGLTADKLETALHFKEEGTSDRLRTRIEAKDLLHISMPTLDRMIRDGQLHAVRIRGRVMVPQSALNIIIAGVES